MGIESAVKGHARGWTDRDAFLPDRGDWAIKGNDEFLKARRKADEASLAFLNERKDLYLHPRNVPAIIHLDIDIFETRLALTDESGKEIKDVDLVRSRLQEVVDNRKKEGVTSLASYYLKILKKLPKTSRTR